MKIELEQERKIDEFYSDKLTKSKKINGIVESKKKKGKFESSGNREFQQFRMVEEIKD